MTESPLKAGERRALLGGRNLAVMAAAGACLVVGYLMLQSGSTSGAAVLLVLGYCVLLPVAIAL